MSSLAHSTHPLPFSCPARRLLRDGPVQCGAVQLDRDSVLLQRRVQLQDGLYRQQMPDPRRLLREQVWLCWFASLSDICAALSAHGCLVCCLRMDSDPVFGLGVPARVSGCFDRPFNRALASRACLH